ncbi:MAG: hypothetical protein ACFFCW_34510 [Candidatus Hodarchaeota archaeon]
MKKLLLINLLILSCLALHSSAGIRGTEWGMSKEQVRKIEKSEFIGEQDGYLCYETTLSGLNTWLCFRFNHRDQLYSIWYGFQTKHVNKNLYIDDFKRISKILREKYGKPHVYKEIWKRDLYKNDKDHWGMAIAVGDLAYYANWEGETDIRHVLRGDNFKIGHWLIYSNTELRKEYEEFKKNKEIEKKF